MPSPMREEKLLSIGFAPPSCELASAGDLALLNYSIPGVRSGCFVTWPQRLQLLLAQEPAIRAYIEVYFRSDNI